MKPKSNKNMEYWKKRNEFNLLEQEKSTQQMTIELKQLYDNMLKDIDKEIFSFYGKYAGKQGLTLEQVQIKLNPKELKTAKEDINKYYNEVDKYVKDGKLPVKYQNHLKQLSAMAYMSRLEEFKVQINHNVEMLAIKQLELETKNLTDIYKSSYKNNINTLNTGLNMTIGLSTLDKKTIEKAINTKWLDANYSSRIGYNKDKLITQLQTTFVKGIALGHNPKKIARDISKNLNTSYNNAVRLARTEANYISNQSTLDSYIETGITKYQYYTNLDDKTSQECTELDGQIYDVKLAEVGINYPPMHPNCRSTTIPYFE